MGLGRKERKDDVVSSEVDEVETGSSVSDAPATEYFDLSEEIWDRIAVSRSLWYVF